MFQLTQTTFDHRILPLFSTRKNLEKLRGQHACAHKNSSLQRNPVQENLQQKAFVEVRELQGRGGPDRLRNRKKWLELRQHAALWHCANDLCFDLAFVEQQHGGNAHDIETTSNVAVVVHIEFGNGDL